MKVDVIQVEQAIFKSRCRWWSNWIDIAVFDYVDTSYLIQMKVNRCNGKRFKTVKTTGLFSVATARTSEVGDLVPMRNTSND